MRLESLGVTVLKTLKTHLTEITAQAAITQTWTYPCCRETFQHVIKSNVAQK